jgi:hypothetical protein
MVSHLPSHDWRLGATFFVSSLLVAAAWLIARAFFARGHVPVHPANLAPPASTPEISAKA